MAALHYARRTKNFFMTAPCRWTIALGARHCEHSVASRAIQGQDDVLAHQVPKIGRVGDRPGVVVGPGEDVDLVEQERCQSRVGHDHEVPVLDVSHLVGQDRVHLLGSEHLQQPGGDHDS